MAERELFRMNDHGDTWQEPELFDQLEERPAVDLVHVTLSNGWEMMAPAERVDQGRLL